jgi:phospholipid/cholesterol/gamma-HCH transport system substrate-binding protein
MSREAKVGIFVVLGILVLTFFTFRVSKLGGVAGKGYKLTVDFENAGGLEPKANVKMAGVPIGKVEEIQLVGNRARLVLRIDKDVHIPVDSVASIQTQGLLGEKYVEISPGKRTDQMLPSGGRIANTQPPMNLDEIVRKVSLIADDVKRFTDSLAGTFGTEEGRQALAEILQNVREASLVLRNVAGANEERLNRILVNVDRLSGDLKDIASANKEDVRATIANLREFSRTLKEQTPGLAANLEKMGEQVGGMVEENRENLKEAIANFKVASARLDNTLTSAEQVMGRIEKGEGTFGRLLSDNTIIGNLSDAVEGISRYVRRGENLKTFIDYRLEYQTSPSEFKHYVNVRLQPAADKYYLLGIVDDPRGKLDVTDTTTTVDGVTTTSHTETFANDLKFSALIAKRFSGLTVKGGVLESTGGIGADYELIKDRLTVGLDAFDFGKKRGQRPHLKAYGNYDIVKNLFITGGVDDILNEENNLRTFFLGFGIKFADEDLKTLFGAVPIRP